MSTVVLGHLVAGAGESGQIKVDDEMVVDTLLDGVSTKALLGAGIVASGGTGAQGDAHWEKYSNGYARIWGRAWVSDSNASSMYRDFTINLPINMIADKWTLEGGIVDSVDSYGFIVFRNKPTAGSKTVGTISAIQPESNVRAGYGYINWHAEGRYE